jgi:predicted ferric reductase
MGLYLKDYKTGRKSLTLSAVVLTFILVVVSVMLTLTNLVTRDAVVWQCIAFHAFWVAIYARKRIKASVTGVEIESEVTNDNSLSNPG